MYYIFIFYNTTRSQTELIRLSFKKVVLEFTVKILDKYTNQNFLKTYFYNSTSSQIFFKDFDHSY